MTDELHEENQKDDDQDSRPLGGDGASLEVFHGYDWTIPEAAHSVIPSEIVRIVVLRDNEKGDPAYDVRVRIAAAQALVAMNRQNQVNGAFSNRNGQDHVFSPEQIRSRLLVLAERIQSRKLVEDV